VSTTRTIEVYADTFGKAHCSAASCRAPIEWATVVKSGKKMCFNNEIVALRTFTEPGSGRQIAVVDFETNHWASCPDRDRFRSGRQR
jgi:hypothetical protein